MRRKNIFVLLCSILLLASTTIRAQSVSEKEAKLVAKNYYSNNLWTKNQEAHFTVTNIRSELNPQGQVMFYILQINNTGFMIVANDKRVPAILAHGKTGGEDFKNFESPEIRYLLNRYKKQIACIKASKAKATQATAKQWNTLLHSSRESKEIPSEVIVAPLTTTKWNQMGYYNDAVPNNYPTGCVPTAISQFLRYHGTPTKATGTNYYKVSISQTKHWLDLEQKEHNWEAMPNVLNSPNKDVADLMLYVGASLNAHYDQGNTGVHEHRIAEGLQQHWGYANTGLIPRADYNDQDWANMMKASLDKSYPVVYVGYDDAGGHTWLVDGYSDDEYFHMNWGWGGACDGWFSLNDLTNCFDWTFDINEKIILNTPNAEPIWADLTIENLHLQDTVVAGDRLAINFDLKNIGDAYTNRGFRLNYYFSSEPVLNPDSSAVFQAWSSKNITKPMPFRSEKSLSISGTINEELTAGTYYFIVVIDEKDDIIESNENNTFVQAVYVKEKDVVVDPQSTDLIVNSIGGTPSRVQAGKKISYAYGRVQNQGTVKSVATTLKYYISAQTTFDSTAVFLGEKEMSALNGGASRYYTVYGITVPENTPAGDYYLLFWADANDVQPEIDETNNVKASRKIKVTTPTSRTSKNIQAQIQVYPSPAQNTLKINLGGVKVQNISVYTLNGVFQRSINAVAQQDGTITYDTSGLKEGTYLINISLTNGQKIIKRFLVFK
ncbi:C10 family peptidase [uncultured Microscilla sp.]|uniref:C10 family peptidase n=1 Tax=uncultured Microscilla sp. TaxID=432653 RepID=UPI002623D2ED|nr:C10 family peptidase [uncultured Microscilla sp.]